MDEAAARHGLEVQVSTREPETKGFEPLPPRWRIEATFGALATRHRLLSAYHRDQNCTASSNRP